MPRSRIFTPVVCLIAAVVVLGLFFLANAGEAASDTTASPAEGAAPSEQVDKAKIGEAYGKLPMSFVANEGQTDERVKFMSRGKGYSLYLTANEAVLVLIRSQAKPAPKPAAKPSPTASPATFPCVFSLAVARGLAAALAPEDAPRAAYGVGRRE